MKDDIAVRGNKRCFVKSCVVFVNAFMGLMGGSAVVWVTACYGQM